MRHKGREVSVRRAVGCKAGACSEGDRHRETHVARQLKVGELRAAPQTILLAASWEVLKKLLGTLSYLKQCHVKFNYHFPCCEEDIRKKLSLEKPRCLNDSSF